MKLHCSKCGAQGEISCECGVEYIRAGELAKKMIVEHPEMSNRAIAAKYGIAKSTIWVARKEFSENPQIGVRNRTTAPENPKRTGTDGKTYPSKRMTQAEKWAAHQREMGAPYPEFKIEKATEIGRMPNDTREKYEAGIAAIKGHLVKLELMTDYADQMSTELRHLLTDELNGIKKHIATIAKKMFGKDNLRDVDRPACDVEIPLRKEDENPTIN